MYRQSKVNTLSLGNTWYHIIAIITVAIWGTTFVSTKTLINYNITPLSIFLYRFTIAYACTLALCHKRVWARNFRDESLMCLAGITGGSLYFITENTALEFTYASDVSLLICTAPIFTLCLNKIAFGITLKKRMIIGSFIALCGVGFVVFNGVFNFGINPLGDLLTIVAALSWSAYCIILKTLGNHYSTLFITRKVFAYGLLSAFFIIYCNPVKIDLKILTQPKVWLNLLFLGIVASMLCFLMWNKVVSKLGANKASNYIYLTPLFTIITAVIYLSEQFTVFSAAGSCLIIGGICLVENSK